MQTYNPDKTQPYAQWEEVEVTFPSSPNTDIQIKTLLTPRNPETVNYQVTRATAACRVYHDGSATRTPWQRGWIRLRCDVANAQVRLLLWVSHETPYFTQSF